MGDASITKVNARSSPIGEMGQKYLAIGVKMSMRLWENEPPAARKPETSRDYETIGYCIKGHAVLHLEGQNINLGVGDSWVVPKGAMHTYEILETFTAVESTSPPSEIHGRDKTESVKH